MESGSTTPIYIQIAEELRHEVLIGALDEGDQVMSTTKYATTYRINPVTAAKAFTALVDEGLLVKKRGIGMFITAGARERLRTAGRVRFIQDSLLLVVEETLAPGLTPNGLIDAIRTHVRSAEIHTKEH